MTTADVIQIDISSDFSKGEQCRIVLQQIGREAEQLTRELQSGLRSWDEYSGRMDALSRRAQAVNTAFNSATGGMDKIGGSAGIATHRMMAFAGTLDDLQYVPQMGLRPILNNLAQFSPQLAIAAIGFQILYQNAHYVTDLFGEGHVQTEAERVEELGKKAHKTAEEYAYLARAKRGEAAIEAVANARPEAETKADKAALAAIGEAGGGKSITSALQAANPDWAANQPEVIAAQKEVQKWRDAKAQSESMIGETLTKFGNFERDIAEAEKKVFEARQRAYDRAVEDATNGQDTPGGRQRLAQMLRKNPKAIGGKAGELADQLDAIGQGRDLKEEGKAAAKRRDEIAGDLQGRYNVARAGGEDVTEATIRAELERAGVSTEEAAKQAGAVLGKLQAGYTEEIRGRASKKGLDRAGADADILADDARRVEREGAAGRRAEAGEDRAEDRRAGELAKPLQDRFNLESARAGRDDAIDEGMVRAELEAGGATEDEAEEYAAAVLDKLRDAFNEELRKRAGKEGTDVAGASDSIVADSRKKVDAAREKMLDSARQSGEKAEADRKEKSRDGEQSSQVFSGASALRDAIQQSIKAAPSDPTAAASLAVQRSMEGYLKAISEKKFGGGPARAG